MAGEILHCETCWSDAQPRRNDIPDNCQWCGGGVRMIDRDSQNGVKPTKIPLSRDLRTLEISKPGSVSR